MTALEKKLQKLCYKTSNRMKEIDKLPAGNDKLMERAIALKLFYAEVCLMVVPQTSVNKPIKTENQL